PYEITPEPTAARPAPPYRATPHHGPSGQRTLLITSTAMSSATGHTRAPICGASPGDQPGGWWAAGSQVCSQLAARLANSPNTSPTHAIALPVPGDVTASAEVGGWRAAGSGANSACGVLSPTAQRLMPLVTALSVLVTFRAP